MFIRARWFLYGALVALGATAYLAAQVKRMRERLTPQTMARAGASTGADLLILAGRAITPDEDRSREVASG
jgi:hypothetical protein